MVRSEYAFFKLRADDGNLYILRHQTSVPDGDWELVSFRETKPELAVHIGLGRPFISRLESGQKEPCLRSLETLADGFGMSSCDTTSCPSIEKSSATRAATSPARA